MPAAPPAIDRPHAASNGKPHEPDAPAAHAAELDRAAITARLLETVRDRTGYPIETLGLDLDMEADLGIDSIKRVEILGKMRDEFPVLKGLSDSAEAMDALARARTLGVIVDRMTSPRGKGERPIRVASREARRAFSRADRRSRNGKPHEPTQRRLLEAVDAPLPVDRLGLMPGGRVVITDDGAGVAAELASLLQAADVAVHRIGGPDQPIDWSSPSAIESAVERLRSRGPIAGIVHALPLARRAWRSDARARLGRADRRRGEGPFPAGQGHGRRSGERRAGGRSVPDRRHGPGRSIRQRRVRRPPTSSPATAASPGWSRRWRANGPRSAAAWSTSRPMHHAKRSPRSWPTRSS